MAAEIFCNGGKEINTALGCIAIDSSEGFVGWLLPKLFAIVGGIAFLMMISGSIQILTSSGNPEKVKAGSQQVTGAIYGLLFIVFSLFVLRLVGVDILHLPGLQK